MALAHLRDKKQRYPLFLSEERFVHRFVFLFGINGLDKRYHI